MKEVAVVILNFNGFDYLLKFLPILIKNTPKNTQIVLADNASIDQSIELVESKFPTIHIIKLAKNFGFAEGYNQALKQIKAKYFILLNSDVEVTPNWLEPLINQLQNPKIAACQPKILSFENKDHFEYAGAAGGYIDFFGYPLCRGRIINNIEKDTGQYDDNVKIFWASGACMGIKSEIFHKIGGFDGDFFAHMEEIDLCWRLHLEDFEIMYTSESTVYHIGGGTLAKGNPLKTYLNFRNGLIMLFKNLPNKGFYWRFLCRLIMDGIASIGYLLKGQFADFWAVFRAHISFYAQLNKLIQKRKNIKKLSFSESEIQTIIPKSLLFEYFKNPNLLYSDLKFKNQIRIPKQ